MSDSLDPGVVAPEHQYRLEIPETRNHAEGFTLYRITAVCSATEQEWQVERRYSDFKTFDDDVRREAPSVHFELPPKKKFGKLKPEFVEERRFRLENYLKAVACTKAWAENPAFAEFLARPEVPSAEEMARRRRKAEKKRKKKAEKRRSKAEARRSGGGGGGAAAAAAASSSSSSSSGKGKGSSKGGGGGGGAAAAPAPPGPPPPAPPPAAKGGGGGSGIPTDLLSSIRKGNDLTTRG